MTLCLARVWIIHNIPATQLFFDSEIQKDLICSSCQHARSLFERFRDFSLDFPQGTSDLCTLESMLDAYLRNECLEATCPSCGENKSEMHKSLRSLPRVFIFHLKRFLANYTTRKYEKWYQKVQFPQTLDMTPRFQRAVTGRRFSETSDYCVNIPARGLNRSDDGNVHNYTATPIGQDKEADVSITNSRISHPGFPPVLSPLLGHATYGLRAIVAHQGNSPHSGHYVCYSCNDQNKWKLHDDSVVRDLPDNAPIEGLGASAYLLFYVRQTCDTSPGFTHECDPV